ncbi:MAG: group II intron reverse transcriptase/maturase [Acidobacteria bacterium]|nr:MAG: group II intron reverse transcriptase/maturase [Acidobacteriota bacterium]
MRMSTQLEQIATKAKADRTLRFTSLAHVLTPAFLIETWQQMNRRGASGVDGETTTEFEREVETRVQDICARLKAGTYRAPPVRRVEIPKGPGKVGTRPLGIPTVEDRLVQRAVARIVEAVFEADFLDCSYGFRPRRSAHHALRTLRATLVTKKVRHLYEADIRGYFNHINHQWLKRMVAHRIADGVILRLIGKWLRAGVMQDGVVVRTEAGIPQGGPISPLIANAYLHALDVEWETRMRGAKLIRYCDDLVILCRGNPQPWFRRLEDIIGRLGLTLNAEKTRTVDAADGFDFLGMHFRLMPMRSNPKRRFCYRWPSTKAMRSIRHKVRDAVGYDDIYSLEEKIRALNPILRGWGQYFRIGNAHRHFKKAGLYQPHGTVVHRFRTLRGEHSREAG